MTFNELLVAIGAVAGVVTGVHFGYVHWGFSGAVGGGILGLIVGCILTIFPTKAGIAIEKYRIRRTSTDGLKTLVNLEHWQRVDFVLLELQRRGVDVSGEAVFLFDLMRSEHLHERLMGKRAFESCFPSAVDILGGYSPFEDASTCREKVARIAWNRPAKDDHSR